MNWHDVPDHAGPELDEVTERPHLHPLEMTYPRRVRAKVRRAIQRPGAGRVLYRSTPAGGARGQQARQSY